MDHEAAFLMSGDGLGKVAVMTVEWIALGASVGALGVALWANRLAVTANQLAKEANTHAVEKDRRESIRFEASMRETSTGRYELVLQNAGTVVVHVHKMTLKYITAAWWETFLLPQLDPGDSFKAVVRDHQAPWAMDAELTVEWSRGRHSERENRKVAVDRPVA